MKKAKTFTALIYMAGDFQIAKHICREFCKSGMCVTIEPLDFIYTGGEETGFRVGLINYPKFPAKQSEIKLKARLLATKLRQGLFQDSYTIVYSDETVWDSYRDE